jgi:predicted RNA-binding protein with PUA-like domain
VARRSPQHWLVKTEPETFAWETLVRDGRACWDGVRNFTARNHLRAMRAGDTVLVYHSGDARAVVGIARVAREAYPDPTTDDDRWSAVDVVPVRPLPRPVALAEIKAERALQALPLVRQPRLSVMPLPPSAARRIVALARARPASV